MPTAAQLVADEVRRSIVVGELQEGEALPPEPELVQRHGVSRPTLREALRILQSEELITIRRGSRGGARVNAPRIDAVARQAGYLLQHQQTSLRDVHDARLVIEPPAAGLLAEQGSAEALDDLRATLAAEAAAGADAGSFARTSAQFHQRVIELAGNHTLSLFVGVLTEIIAAQTESVVRQADHVALERDSGSAHRSHERLVELVEAGDADAARAHWRAHLEAIGGVMLRGQGSRRVVDLLP